MNNDIANDIAYRKLPGADNLKARALYRALIGHHRQSSCPDCDSYIKYGTTIVKGNRDAVLSHLDAIAGHKVKDADFLKLKKAGLIGLEEISSDQHRIVFNIKQEVPA